MYSETLVIDLLQALKRTPEARLLHVAAAVLNNPTCSATMALQTSMSEQLEPILQPRSDVVESGALAWDSVHAHSVELPPEEGGHRS